MTGPGLGEMTGGQKTALHAQTTDCHVLMTGKSHDTMTEEEMMIGMMTEEGGKRDEVMIGGGNTTGTGRETVHVTKREIERGIERSTGEMTGMMTLTRHIIYSRAWRTNLTSDLMDTQSTT